MYVGVDAKEFNLRIAPRLKDSGHPHRPIRQPAGLGLAPGTGAHDRQGSGPGAVPAAVRETVLRHPFGARGIRRSSACRRRAHGAERRDRALPVGAAREGPIRRGAARQPAGRGVAAQPGLHADHGVAAPRAAPVTLHRGAGQRAGAQSFRGSPRARGSSAIRRCSTG